MQLFIIAEKDLHLEKTDNLITPMQKAMLDQKHEINESQSQIYDLQGNW